MAISLRKWLKRAPRPMLASAVFFAIAFIINHSGKGLDWQLTDPTHNMVYVVANASAAAFGTFLSLRGAFPGAVGRVRQRLGGFGNCHADRAAPIDSGEDRCDRLAGSGSQRHRRRAGQRDLASQAAERFRQHRPDRRGGAGVSGHFRDFDSYYCGVRGNDTDLGVLKIMAALRNFLVKSILWLAAGLLVLPACVWLSGTRTNANPITTNPIVSLSPTQTASLPADLPVQATLPATAMQSPTTALPPILIGTAAPVYGQIALRHLEALSERIGPRQAGTTKEAKAAEYIETALNELGYQTSLQPFTFPGADGATQNSANVIGVKAGISTQEIIVGAHYDSIPAGKGADDNASGVAVMLEVAEMVINSETPYTIRFIAFGAEEAGLYGSGYYVRKMSAADIQNTISMINLDSLAAGDTANVYGDASPGNSLRNWLLVYAKSQGLELETQPVEKLDYPDGRPCDCADYSAFQTAGIPFAYFEATDWTLGDQDGWTQVDPKFGQKGEIWNTKYDYLDYIDQNFPGRVERHLDLFVRLLFGALTEYK